MYRYAPALQESSGLTLQAPPTFVFVLNSINNPREIVECRTSLRSPSWRFRWFVLSTNDTHFVSTAKKHHRAPNHPPPPLPPPPLGNTTDITHDASYIYRYQTMKTTTQVGCRLCFQILKNMTKTEDTHMCSFIYIEEDSLKLALLISPLNS